MINVLIKPTREGWWWARPTNGNWQPVLVLSNGKIMRLGYGGTFNGNPFDAWIGPIEPPEVKA